MTPEETRLKVLKEVFLDERTRDLLARVNNFTLETGRESGFKIFYNHFDGLVQPSAFIEGTERECPLGQAIDENGICQTVLAVHSHPNKEDEYNDGCEKLLYGIDSISDQDISMADLMHLSCLMRDLIAENASNLRATTLPKKIDLETASCISSVLKKFKEDNLNRAILPVQIKLHPWGREEWCNLDIYQFLSPFDIDLGSKVSGPEMAEYLANKGFMIRTHVDFDHQTKSYISDGKGNEDDLEANLHDNELKWMEIFAKHSLKDIDAELLERFMPTRKIPE